MSVLLMLEYGCDPNKKTWVARITGLSGKFGLERDFVASVDARPMVGTTGKRGYVLDNGLHEVCEKGERIFVSVEGESLLQLRKEDAMLLLGAMAPKVKPLTDEEKAELARLAKQQKDRDKLKKLRRQEQLAAQKEFDDALADKLGSLNSDQKVKFTSEGGFDVVSVDPEVPPWE